MRVLFAPDKFAGTLTSRQAAEAMAEGWRTTAPWDDVELLPMSDGGPGFVDVVHSALGGSLLSCAVRGPLGGVGPASVLVSGDTAYVESAQACGLEVLGQRRDPERASTYGVGQLLLVALQAGAERGVGGLGGFGGERAGGGVPPGRRAAPEAGRGAAEGAARPA